jgi:putative flippase GtrA
LARPLLQWGGVSPNRFTTRRDHSLLVAGLVGLLGTLLDVVVLVIGVEAGVPVPAAAFLGASVGAFACFLANKHWAFRDRSALSLRQVSAFGGVAVGAALLLAAAMALVADGMGVPYLHAKAICAAAVFLGWSYPAQRRFVFRPAGARRRLDLSLDPARTLV